MSFEQIEINYKKFKNKYVNFDYNLDEKGQLVITLNKNPGNTMDLEFFSEIYHIFKSINHIEEDIRVVVIKSSLKHFSFGLDLKKTVNELYSNQNEENGKDFARKVFEMDDFIKKMQKSFLQIEKCKVPVIAVVRGFCIGGGVDLISACDMVYCDETAKFSIREIKIGLAADLGTLNRLAMWCSNQTLLKEIAFTGRFFDVSEASDLGLIYKAYPIDALDKHISDLTEEICGNSPVATMVTKKGINFQKKENIKKGLDFMKNENRAYLFTEDVFKSVSSQMDKQKPLFPKL
jgi:enoyl-CoA hydratase/carnithine racemase